MPWLRGLGQDAPATGSGETRCPGYGEWGNQMPRLRGVGKPDDPATGSGEMPRLRGVGKPDAPATGVVNVKNFTYPNTM